MFYVIKKVFEMERNSGLTFFVFVSNSYHWVNSITAISDILPVNQIADIFQITIIDQIPEPVEGSMTGTIGVISDVKMSSNCHTIFVWVRKSLFNGNIFLFWRDTTSNFL